MKRGELCGLGRLGAMEDEMITEVTFSPRRDATTAPGAAGAAALRKMCLPEQDGSLTPRFDRCPTFDRNAAPSERMLPKANALGGCRSGSGPQLWPDGARYEGEYKDGLKHGIGRFSWASGAVYEGDFVEDRLEGQGYFRWRCGSTYEGSWRHGRMHGSGLFTWPDGRSYEGEYQNDFKNGKGIFRWPDGRQYDGQWKDGVQNGRGTFTSATGRSKMTEWRDGQVVRSSAKADLDNFSNPFRGGC